MAGPIAVAATRVAGNVASKALSSFASEGISAARGLNQGSTSFIKSTFGSAALKGASMGVQALSSPRLSAAQP